MKKAAEIRYPNSANLFQFCRQVLDHKFGGIRVIDQDVGQILGFDPADCSHWKKGKKNIRSIHAIKAIADHLGVDERLIVDIATGELDDQEAYVEYNGYGEFEVSPRIIDAAKKEFYRQNATGWSRDKEQEFKLLFDANEPKIEEIVAGIHAKIDFKEAPLYLPEIVGAYPSLHLNPVARTELPGAQPLSYVVRQGGDGSTSITYESGTEMKPFMRYRLAKAISKHFLHADTFSIEPGSGTYSDAVWEVRSNLFAAKLLTPKNLIRNEMQKIVVSKDIVSQLAEIFWVSKSFMNRRLKEILQRDRD